MKFIELFAGIGGFRLGLEKEGHECVWANEWLERPRGIYEYNFKEAINGEDIRTITADDVPDADLIVGGFPCATFSYAGKKTGFSVEDTRGTLFFEIARICAEKRPRNILLENVKGLLSHDYGKTFQTILGVLANLGYRVEWQVLNSKDFGVPQNRERVFIVGHLGGTSGRQVFPITGSNGKIREKSEGEQRGRQGVFSDISPTLDAHYGKGGASRPYVAVRPVITPSRTNKRQEGRRFKNDGEPSFTLTAQDVHGVELKQITQKTRQGSRIYDPSGISPTLMAAAGGLGGKTGLYQIDTKIRKLTPLECERLQGLPDNFTKYRMQNGKVIQNSDNLRYERCGRTVTIPVIEAIGERLKRIYDTND